MTSDAGVPGAPRFDVVLRGYDRRQVDEHVDRLQRVLLRMRADLEVARSQPMPPVTPSRPAAARPRPTPRPRPGGAADHPDTIGNFTDRMKSILQSAEEEAAEIRRNAHLAARAETDGVRSQVADLMRQRDAVLAELTRMRSQLEGLLAAPTAQLSVHESMRYGRPGPAPRFDHAPPLDPARRFDHGPRPSDQGFRPAGGPGVDPVRRPTPVASTGPNAPVGPGPSAPSGVANPGASTPPSPEADAPTPAGSAPGEAPRKPGANGASGSTPASPSGVSSTSDSPASVSEPESEKPGSAPATPPSASSSSSSSTAGVQATTTALPAVGPASERRADTPGTGAGTSSGSDTSGSDTSGSDTSGSDTSGSDTSGSRTSGSTESEAASATPMAGPEREEKKAAHRLPTGAYPAVADSASMRPDGDPDSEPADLFRPVTRGTEPEPQTTEVSGSADDADDQDRDAAASGVEATTKVPSVRPQEPTAGRSDRGEGHNGTPRPTSPSRSG